jgi:hypothetical protein
VVKVICILELTASSILNKDVPGLSERSVIFIATNNVVVKPKGRRFLPVSSNAPFYNKKLQNVYPSRNGMRGIKLR